MVYCVVLGCNNRSVNTRPGITFHNLPKDTDRRELWVKAIGRENWAPSKHSKICSSHFLEKDIDRTSLSVVRIRENSVPSVFPFLPANYQRNKKIKNKSRIPGGSYCSVAVCKNSWRKAKINQKKLMFFSFPKDPDIRKQWIKNCFRKDKFSPDTRKICADHFTLDDYTDKLQAKIMGHLPRKLKDNAIPSLHLRLPNNILSIEEHDIKIKTEQLIHNSAENSETFLNYREFTRQEDTRKICADHFILDNYTDKLQANTMGHLPRKLKDHAVPSLHLHLPNNIVSVEKHNIKIRSEQLIHNSEEYGGETFLNHREFTETSGFIELMQKLEQSEKEKKILKTNYQHLKHEYEELKDENFQNLRKIEILQGILHELQ